MLHKTRVAIRFRAKKPSPQTTRNFALVCLWCGRTVGRSVGVLSRDYQIFSDGLFTTFCYPWCSAARFARESSAIIFQYFFYFYCNLFCYLLTYLFTYWFFYLLLRINVVNLLSGQKWKIKNEKTSGPDVCFAASALNRLHSTISFTSLILVCLTPALQDRHL